MGDFHGKVRVVHTKEEIATPPSVRGQAPKVRGYTPQKNCGARDDTEKKLDLTVGPIR